MIRYLTWNLVMGDLSAPLYQMMQPFNPVARGEILYLPAARTGFVLMRKVLASGFVHLPDVGRVVLHRQQLDGVTGMGRYAFV